MATPRRTTPRRTPKVPRDRAAVATPSLFEAGASDGVASRPAPGLVRFGTSSFTAPGWVGTFYPEGTRPADFLRVYAREFDTVEVDATYYAVPSARTVDGWAEKTPEGFVVAAKFPRSIVHGGDAERPDPHRVLTLDAIGEERDRFLGVMARLGPRLGPLVLQFPYFNREAFPSVSPFLERLDAFLAALPPARRTRSRCATGRGSARRSARCSRGTGPRWCSSTRRGCPTATRSSRPWTR